MDEKDKQKSSAFNRPTPVTFEHFRPLSKYSLLMKCEQKAGLHQTRAPPHPFVNFKIEVLNNCQKKRKSDHIDSYNSYETPAKKVFSPSAQSPDLGCVMDYSTPTSRLGSLSSLATSKFSLPDASHSESGEIITANISSELQSQQVKLSVALANIKKSSLQGLKGDGVPSGLAPVFDCDVDDILCLNPVPASTAVQLPGLVESSKLTSEHTLKPNPVTPSTGHWKVEQEKRSRKDDEEDKGYFSGSYVKDFSPSGYSPPPFVTSSPMAGSAQAPEHEPGGSAERVKLSVELLEGDVEEPWSIGQPMFESSLCQKTSVKPDPDAEGNVLEPIHEGQASLGSGDTSSETSYESSLPLVKVKSVVIAPTQPMFSSKPSSCSDPNDSSSTLSLRAVIFRAKADLQREKRLYVQSVMAHMNERSPVDPVSELRNLMTRVADQTIGRCREQWQHPSDFTQRNYRKRFGSMSPNVSLAEWWAKNRRTHKLFSNIPKNL